MARVLGVIPARFGSTRFPGKPLALIAGRPMIWHVYRRCRRARLLDEVVVATDDRRIAACVDGFGGTVVMTSRRHRSGTDRIAEVLRKSEIRSSEYEIVINIQGDEPLVAPAAIDQLARAMLADPRIAMATLATQFRSRDELASPHTAKIVTDRQGFALYFSRSVIPHHRGPGRPDLARYLKHIGMYAYRSDFLRTFTGWRPSRLEKTERLEQLRALEHGVRIKVVNTRHYSPSVDTPSDLRRVARLMK